MASARRTAPRRPTAALRLGPEFGSIPPGLRSGDGVFETLRTFGGVPFLLDRHLARLRRGARSIGLLPVPSAAALRQACRRALDLSLSEGRSGERLLRPMLFASSAGPRLSVGVEPLPAPVRRTGGPWVLAGISSYPHPGRYLVPPGASAPVKWLARGPLAHALREAKARGWDEALLKGEGERVVEGTRSNLLAVVRGTLLAPGAESHALPGITREVALEETRGLGVEVEERAPTVAELRTATELALTSSLLGVAPLARLAGVGWRPSSRGTAILARVARAYDARTGA